MDTKVTVSVALALIWSFGWNPAPALGKTDDAGERELESFVRALDTNDVSGRAEAEMRIRIAGQSALRALRSVEVMNRDGFLRQRQLLMDLTIEFADASEKDAGDLGELAREEAMAGRYAIAVRGYKRAQTLFARLERSAIKRDLADKARVFREHRDKAGERYRKALALAREDGHRLARWGRVPGAGAVKDDGDW